MSDMHESPSSYDVFQKKGHPGRWTNAVRVTTESVDFTGTPVWGGVMVAKYYNTGSFLDINNQKITLSGGGYVSASQFEAGIVHEVSVKQVSGSTGSTNPVYVFKRNG